MTRIASCPSSRSSLRPVSFLPVRFIAAAALAGAAFLSCGAAQAQSVYAGIGSAGLTAGYAHTYSDLFGARAELGWVPSLSRSFVEDGIDYTGSIRGLRAAALFDLHPLRGGFRLTAGLSGGELSGEFSGAPSTGSTITIGGATVNVGPADSYTVIIEMPSVMPYVGVGWGHAPPRGWGFHADVGALIGSAKVSGTLSPSLRAKIALGGLNPDAELERELDSIRETAGEVSVIPVLSIGVSYRW
jgi:hypothetical protein